MLELWGMQNTPLLPILSSMADAVSSSSCPILFKVRTLNVAICTCILVCILVIFVV